MPVIKHVAAREILDSRGTPTVEAEVTLDNGMKAWAQVPSGASTGKHEALELRDGDERRFQGKGVLEAVRNVTTELAPAIIGLDPVDQRGVDNLMMQRDGTDNKASLGANAILSVSLAVCRAGAMAKGVPLYRHIAEIHHEAPFESDDLFDIPIPLFNVINGGKHADSGLAIQEYKIVPDGIPHYSDQYRAGAEIFMALKKILADEGLSTAVGDEGGFAPRLPNNTAPLEKIAQAVDAAGYRMGKDIHIAIDAAASSFYCGGCDNYAFKLEDSAFTSEELVDIYQDWITNHHVISIEDGLDEDDWDGWVMMRQKLGNNILSVGDDLLVTNVARLNDAIERKACNAILIKPNQIGSVSETLACMRRAQQEEFTTIVSHRSGETTDDFIADLAVGAGADYIKTGSLSRGERICKYNRLLAINERIEKSRGKGEEV